MLARTNSLLVLLVLFAPVVVLAQAEEATGPWFGNVKFGYLATSGNTDNSNLNTSFQVGYETGKWVHTFDAFAINATEDNTTTAESYELGWKSERSLSEKDFLFHTFIERDTGERELYELASDPYQLRNLAGTPAAHGLETALASRLTRLRGCLGATCRPAPDLALTLRPLPGTPGRSIGCRVAVGIAGRARPRVGSARLSAGGFAAGRLRRGSLRAVVRTGAPAVRARVRLRDDRVVTLDAALPGC
jgi:hypothetical protein